MAIEEAIIYINVEGLLEHIKILTDSKSSMILLGEYNSFNKVSPMIKDKIRNYDKATIDISWFKAPIRKPGMNRSIRKRSHK